jgi:alpha-L-rhamnosidase
MRKFFTEYAEAPLAIGTRTPRFSWEVPLKGRGRKQSAYQLLVATTEALLKPGKADLWDSGRVDSAQSVNVEYAGKKLRSNMDCYWTVRVWDEAGKAAAFSKPEYFGTALFDESDWKAQWIGMGSPDEPFSNPDDYARKGMGVLKPEFAAIEPELRAPMLRTEFTLDQPVKRARLFVCGLGLYTARLNGAKVGEDVLSTPRTDFRKTAVYNTYDVTKDLVEGVNVVGLVLGNGFFNGHKRYWGWQYQWYGSPRGILQLEVELADGTRRTVMTDSSWRADWSAVVSSCIYDGEDYDARKEQPGWDASGFDASSWQHADKVAAPGGTLTPMSCEQELVTELIAPVGMTEPEPGVYVYDMGRNITGWVKLTVRGARSGDEIQLHFGEAQYDDGRINTSSNNAARQQDHYICRGDETEVYEPQFTFHGFQFVEMRGYPGKPELQTLEGRFVRTAVARTGSFKCGNKLINKIHTCTLQSQMCNVQMGVPTDDTQRPERLGWGADAWACAHQAMYNLWMPRLYGKWIKDFCDMQDNTGVVGMITPRAGMEEDLVWSSAFLTIPWWQYIHYGDKGILERSYPYMQKYIEYLEKTGIKEIQPMTTEQIHATIGWKNGFEHRFSAPDKHGYLQLSQWGDHLATAEGYRHWSAHPLSISTAFYYLDVATMARIAKVLGKDADVSAYSALAEKIKTAFNERFYEAVAGYYDGGVQSAQAWPLAFGLVPEKERNRVRKFLVELTGDRQRRLTTGYASTKFAIQALSEAGRDDVIWQLAAKTDYPSWGYMLRLNRTTSCERWDGERGSLNHAPLGSAIDEWFYWGLAGIRADESAPGFENVIIKPHIAAGLEWAKASIRTVRGTVSSEWKRKDAVVSLKISLPANSTGDVYLPVDDSGSVIESGVPVAEAPGINSVKVDNGMTCVRIGSGKYSFEFSMKRKS